MTSFFGWEIAPKAPYSNILSITKVNDNEFMVVSYSSNFNETAGIYTYNINNRFWTLFDKDVDGKSKRSLLTMDRMSNKVYMLQPQWNKCYDAYTIWNKARLHIIDTNQERIIKSFDTDLDLGTNPACLCVNGILHVISGLAGDYHYIWNNKTCKFIEIGNNKHWDGLQCTGFAHISSQNTLLSFGGYYNDDTICKTLIDAINWEKLAIKLPISMAQNGIIVTEDDKFIIFFGNGFNDTQLTDESTNDSKQIYILNWDTMTFMKSWCVMPDKFNKGGSCAVLMCNFKQNSLLIPGYVRRINRFIPNDIIQELILWATYNEIHLFEYDTGCHWKINVTDILAACITIPRDTYT